MTVAKESRIFVAGHKGLVGSAICKSLEKNDYKNLLLRDRQQLDLEDEVAVSDFLKRENPGYIFIAAAKVGGILANNTYPVDFLLRNLKIQNNLISGAYKIGLKKLLFLGSSCIYPKAAPQPMREEHLLTGPLEPTNRPYALAKISGIELCWAYNKQYGTQYIAGMPTNMYGPGDNYDLNNSHVLPALIRKVHEAKVSEQTTVSIWGSGKPLREFLYSEDLGDACIRLMNLSEEEFKTSFESMTEPPLINVGSGLEISIQQLAEVVADVLNYQGKFAFDSSKPDGSPRKLMDNSRMKNLGWLAKTTLREGIALAYEDFIKKFS